MSTLAHVFEAAGLSTVVLASMIEVVEKMAPPRALYCEFPLGRPLGRPGDAAFQRDVLERSLALLDATEPVLETHPEVIEPTRPRCPARCRPATTPTSRRRSTRPAASGPPTTEPLASHGATSVGRAIDADGVPDALDVLHQWAERRVVAGRAPARQAHGRRLP